MKNLLILSLFFIIACSGNDSSSIPEPIPLALTPNPSLPLQSSTWTDDFILLINNHRASIGLRTLIHNDQVGLIAQKHSQNMATGTVAFGHDGFSGRCSSARSELGGGNWCGENVATGQKSPQAAYTAWMNSPGHKANIESARATHTGFGYAKSTSGKLYWTQLFLQF